MIDLRLGGFFEAGVAHIADDANDGAPSSGVILSADAATDRVATGKILPGKTLIDDYRVGIFGVIRIAEEASGDERNVHRRKILRSNPARFSQLTFLIWIAIHREHS